MRKSVSLENHMKTAKTEMVWWMLGLWLLQIAVVLGVYLKK